jgi:hypothetical protein
MFMLLLLEGQTGEALENSNLFRKSGSFVEEGAVTYVVGCKEMCIFRSLQWLSSCYIYIPICTEPYVDYPHAKYVQTCTKLNFCAEGVILTASSESQ